MKNARSQLGLAIEKGLQEAIAYDRGELPNVRTTRRRITKRDSTVAPPPAFPRTLTVRTSD